MPLLDCRDACGQDQRRPPHLGHRRNAHNCFPGAARQDYHATSAVNVATGVGGTVGNDIGPGLGLEGTTLAYLVGMQSLLPAAMLIGVART